MGNVFVNLPLPALNGAGAAVDTSAMGRTKTFVVAGSFPGALITIEASVDGGANYAPVVSFQDGEQKRVVDVAAQFMRVNVSGRKGAVPFTANIDVSSNDSGALFLAIPMPALNGAGATANASALGTFNTFIAAGTFDGARILVEVSEDGVAWAPCALFAGQGGLVSKDVTAALYRANVSGRRAGVPFTGSLAVGAVNDPVTSSGTATNWQSFDYVATGLEAQQFTVTIPVAQPDALYQVRALLGTTLRAFTLELVDGTETVNNFDVVVSTTLTAGDVIHFDVFNAP